MNYRDPLGKTAMDAEGCKAFLPGITEGWETLEKVALGEGSRGFRSVDESLLCRADAYLPKSCDVEELLAFLHALLTRN
jgi:hypothetical protein